MTEREARQKIVGIMQSWIGLNEGNSSHMKILDIYNGHTPLARGYRMTKKDPWCATTVSAAAIAAGYTDIIPCECSCTRMIALFQQMGRWMERDDYNPAPGDCVFYDWNDTGKGDCTGAPEHVGMVEKVSGTTITVIEGNYSDSVKRRMIQVDGRYIRGYGIPDYAGIAASVTICAEVPLKMSVPVTAQQVLNGLYGNGDVRKDRLSAAGYTQEEMLEIQFIVNSLSSGGWTVQVNVNTILNVRSGAGKEKYAVTRTLKNGDIIVITEVRTGDGSKSGWGKLKDNSGWVALDYVETV